MDSYTVLTLISEYLKEADTERVNAENWLVHPSFHNSAGVGTVPWLAILRPSVYIEIHHANGLIVLEFRKWLRLSKADLDYITKQQLAGKSTVSDCG